MTIAAHVSWKNQRRLPIGNCNIPEGGIVSVPALARSKLIRAKVAKPSRSGGLKSVCVVSVIGIAN
jgi:hypothetical protein